jgi:hypothetical protein
VVSASLTISRALMQEHFTATRNSQIADELAALQPIVVDITFVRSI